MAKTTGGDIVLQLLTEVREMQQHLEASSERTAELFEQLQVSQARTHQHVKRVVTRLGRLAEDPDALRRKVADHEKRLSALEREQ
jgi:hypothetical protein